MDDSKKVVVVGSSYHHRVAEALVGASYTIEEANRGFRAVGKVAASKECLLPGCEEYTDHKRGYCSAKCCKEHRKRKKEQRNG